MAKIMVWPMSFVSKIVGHAALLADKSPTQSYVSWWPNGGASLGNPTTAGHSTPTYDDDVKSEGSFPTTVDLPFLDDSAISKWWENYKFYGLAAPYSPLELPTTNNYDLWANNCSTTVLRAMKIGGADLVVPSPTSSVITPSDILSWANRLRDKYYNPQPLTGAGSTAF